MKAVFVRSEQTAENIKTFYFQTENAVDYISGQFVEIRLPHPKPDTRGDKRWFTLSSSPTEQLLAITTKFSSEESSFKNTLESMAPGNEVQISDPMGDFVLPKDPSIPINFIAGGIGITPVRSMLKWLEDNGQNRHIEIIYALANRREILFHDLLLSQSHNLTILTREDDGNAAQLTAESTLAIFQQKKQAQLYLSGPERMIEVLVDQFQETAIRPENIVTDFFPGYPSV